MNQYQEIDYLKLYSVSNPLYIHSESMQAVSKKISLNGMQYLLSLVEQGIIKVIDES